jgi:hypothetical protein
MSNFAALESQVEVTATQPSLQLCSAACSPMNDREFSSPVCYLDYDNEQLVASEPARLCERCKGVVAGLNSVNKGVADHAKYDSVKIFESTINLATISKPACFLCSRFFRHVANSPQQMAKLNDGASVAVEYRSMRLAGDTFILLFVQGDLVPVSKLTILYRSSGEYCLLNSILVTK